MEQILFRIEQLNSLYETYAFLCRQQKTPKEFKSKESFQFAKENFFVLILSQLYSLFDKSGLDLQTIETEDEYLKEIIEDWEKIKKPITRIRHNLGSHGAKRINGTKNATSAFLELDKNGIKIAMELFGKLKKWQLFQISKLNKNR